MEYFSQYTLEDTNAYALNVLDLLSIDDLIESALLLELYTDNYLDTTPENKCKYYQCAILTLNAAKTDESALSSQQYNRINRGIWRLCNKAWKFKSVLGEDKLRAFYEKYELNYTPRGTVAQVFIATYFIALSFNMLLYLLFRVSSGSFLEELIGMAFMGMTFIVSPMLILVMLIYIIFINRRLSNIIIVLFTFIFIQLLLHS
jgi:hypothetical protein